ncbi:MAG: tetratricopeptide repeat protein [Candidatus Omnitrophota bacterium]|nr:MAG: tetratricopeptide repeat protein [Candidatus Omnitrophota bacterium]
MITPALRRLHKLKISLLVTCFLLLATFLVGCTDTRYLSEKLFWHTQRETAKVLKKGTKNLDASDYNKIISLYQRVIDACPLEDLSAESHFIIAHLYASQGKYKEAQQELVNVIHNFSSQPKIAARAQLKIGKLYELQAKPQQAILEYEKVMDLYPLTPLGLNMPKYIVKYYRNINDVQAEERAYQRAIRHYKKLIGDFSQTPMSAVLRDYLASLYVMQADYQEAITVWDKIISDYPQSLQAAKALLAKAQVYTQKLKDIPKAIEIYEEFAEKYSSHKKIHEIEMQLGRLYLEDGQIEQAREIFDALLKDRSQEEDVMIKAHLGIATTYAKQADTKKVTEIYEYVKKVYPESKAALGIPYLTAQYYEQIGYDSKADEAYRAAIAEYEMMLQSDEKKEITKKEAANFLTLCYLKKNEMDKALQLLRMLADRHPQDPMYLLDLASLYRNLNALEKAIGVYNELIARYAHNKLIVSLAQAEIQTLKSRLHQ